MSDRPFTLLDVMLGIDKHDLVCKLTEEAFTFLVGIILAHNRREFDMPFDLNNTQAMAAGGGNTPKSVRRRRATLCKFRIQGKPLLKVISGNYGRNTCAKYEINYKNLLSYNGVWTGHKGLPGQIWAGSGEGGGPVEGAVEGTVPGPILRLDQNRSDKISSSRSNVVTGSNDVTASGKTKKKVIEFGENGVGYVIMKGRGIWGEWVPRVNTLSMDEVEQIARFQKEAIDEAFKANALAMKDTTAKRRPGPGSTRWILNRLQDPEKFGAPKILTEEQKQRKREYEKAEQLEQEQRERTARQERLLRMRKHL